MTRVIMCMVLSFVVATVSLTGRTQPSKGAATRAASRVQDVRFASGDITLSGTLLAPANPIAAVVLVHGSGRELRMLSFAQALASHGIAVLTYDKRGVGQSGGVYAGPEVGTNNVDPRNLDLLAGDASAAVRELARRMGAAGTPRAGRTPVGLWGFSQAGWIIPLAAARTAEVRFMILWSGPLVSTLEQLRFQFLTGGRSSFWDDHSEAQAREHIRSDPDRYQLVATDPVATLRKLSIPGLWLYGGRDGSVPARLSIERLDALRLSGKPFEHRLFPGAGHQLPFDDALAASLNWLMTRVVDRQGSR